MIVTLSPCGQHVDGNVGDQLTIEMTHDVIERVRGPTRFETYFKRSDFTSRLDHINEAEAIILSGFEITQHDTRPENYRIAVDLDDVEPPIIPDCSSYSFFPGDRIEMEEQRFGTGTRNFLDELEPNCPGDEFPVRDRWTGMVLEQNGYDTVLTGDPGWYDLDMLGKEFHRPESIEKLVVTGPQFMRYMSQSATLIRRLTEEFPDAERILSLHIVPRDVDLDLANEARRLGWDVLYASHETEHLEAYRDSDLHVGYRLHGHLAHLRWRRPSIILSEDARGMGLTETLGAGGVRAFEPRELPFDSLVRPAARRGIERFAREMRAKFSCPTVFTLYHMLAATPNAGAVDEAMEYLEYEMANDWPSMDSIRDTIDSTYENGWEPYLRSALA